MWPSGAVARPPRLVYWTVDLDPIERPESPDTLPFPGIRIDLDHRKTKLSQFSRTEGRGVRRRLLLQCCKEGRNQDLSLLRVWRGGAVAKSLPNHGLSPSQFGLRCLNVEGRDLRKQVGP